MKLKKRERKEAAVSIQKVLSLRALLNIFLRKCNKQARIAKKKREKEIAKRKEVIKSSHLNSPFLCLISLIQIPKSFILSLTRLYCVSFFGDITHFFFANLFAKIVDIKNEKKFQMFFDYPSISKKKSSNYFFSSFKFQLLKSSKKWWKQLNNNKKIPMLCKARKLLILIFDFFYQSNLYKRFYFST